MERVPQATSDNGLTIFALQKKYGTFLARMSFSDRMGYSVMEVKYIPW